MITQTQIDHLNDFGTDLHRDNVSMGWWSFDYTGMQALPDDGGQIMSPTYIQQTMDYTRPLWVHTFSNFLVATKISLIHSEASEALEAYRKDLPDSHLPQFPGVVVELADCIIRCIDLIGAFGYDLGDVLAAKLAYNAKRADHKVEARNNGGKKF